MSLQDQIDQARSEIRTDGYPVSIGEWLSLYEKAELDIHPEFQRFFRWSATQKSRLIESIFLGIPIPPIFVAQRADGIWDVVDGLQRLSTIFQFAGVLKDETGQLVSPLVLEATKYLSELKGHVWDEHLAAHGVPLSAAQRLLIKRSKIDASIILKESDEKAKYELFQRLNTGGSPLSDQEVRNSLLVMIDRNIYKWLRDRSVYAPFQECIALTDRALEEQYDMELALRFVVLRTMSARELSEIGDMGDFLTDQAVALAEGKHMDWDRELEAFETTFKLLQDQLGPDCFRRFDWSRGRFVGGFSVSAFEAVALGVGAHYDALQAQPDDIPSKVKELWRDSVFTLNSGSGVRASSRVPRIVPHARQVFAP